MTVNRLDTGKSVNLAPAKKIKQYSLSVIIKIMCNGNLSFFALILIFFNPLIKSFISYFSSCLFLTGSKLLCNKRNIRVNTQKRNIIIIAQFFCKRSIPVSFLSPYSVMNMNCFNFKAVLLRQLLKHFQKTHRIRPA